MFMGCRAIQSVTSPVLCDTPFCPYSITMSADNKKGEAGGISELPVLTRTTASAALGFEIAHNGEDEKDSPSSEADEGAKSIPGVIPLKYRLTAVAMILFISTGTAFAEVTMGPLKSTLQRELGLNSASILILILRRRSGWLV